MLEYIVCWILISIVFGSCFKEILTVTGKITRRVTSALGRIFGVIKDEVKSAEKDLKATAKKEILKK